jgi:uncharacterized membrane protein YjfL (UPF0719 family)
MFVTRVLISLFEFLLAVVMSGMVIYLTYEVFIKANPDFDMELEIKKGNVAVGTLVGSILFAASTILHRGMDSVVSLFRLHMTSPSDGGFALWQLALMGVGHLTMSMVLAVLTISITLRLFGRLTKKMQEGKELEKGNMAVGILLSSVVHGKWVCEGVDVGGLSINIKRQHHIETI